MSKIQDQMQDVLNTAVKDGRERGVQLAVYLDGRLIVDAWAGIADPAAGRPFDGDTLIPTFSATKGLMATLIVMLVARGKLTYDTPVARVWPEFSAHGKGGITVRHVLTHTAGLPYMPMGLGYKQLVDWDVMCSALANERPVHPPGEKKIYHAITYGWLLGEVARRVDGRPVPQQLQEEICAPLGITNMFIGLPRGLEDRVAVLDEIFDPGAIITRDDTQPQDTPNWMLPLHAMMNRLDVQRACLPAANGIMNARSLARHWAALLPGGVDGVELLPEAFVREAATIQEVPPTADTSLQGDPFALAYGIGGKNNQEFGSRTSAFGAGGYVGSTGFADPEYRLAASICKNLRSSNNAQVTIYRALRDALGIPH